MNRLLREQVEAFQVHPQYEDITQKANDLTERMHSLTNTSILRQHLLEHYESSYKAETADIPIADIEKIYAEDGILFGESIRRPFSEVIDFHKTIVSNHKGYLSHEIAALKKKKRQSKTIYQI